MLQRIGAFAGAAILASAALLVGVYQLQQQKMPEGLFTLVSVLLFTVIIFGVPVWLYIWVAAPTIRFIRSRRFQWPMAAKNSPNPHQWLLDIAKNDAVGPTAQLKILQRKWRRFDRTARRPLVEVGITLYNGGVHSVLVGPVTGQATFNGEPLEVEINDARRSRMPRGHEAELRLVQYLPTDETVLGTIGQEYASGRLRCLGFGSVFIDVLSEADAGQSARMPLGGGDFTV